MNDIKKTLLLVLILLCTSAALHGQSAYYGKIKKYSNLYRLPSSHSAILAWLPAQTTVFIASDRIVNGFVQVIYLESGAEGYVYRDVIDFTDKVADDVSENIFTVSFSEQTDTATLTVTNSTNRTLTLKIDNRNYTIVSEEQERIVLASGKHRYILFGAKFVPVTGTEMFENGKNYTWQIGAMSL
ncbi:hypothetical protein FACS189429_1180 [Bacteroidia bacterium]|nr:hypothetical protein FACS189429_1180 [Bacteroidia bacterium]